MRRLLTGHAIYYNYRHRRHGHLFQNRYKSILCQEDAYLLELVRYIHLNPLRAGVMQDIGKLHRYPYAGHSALLGRVNRNWQDTDYVLSFFGKTVSTSRRRYREFVRKAASQDRRPELTGGGLVRSSGGWTSVKAMRKSGFRQKADERILGDGDFVSTTLQHANERFEKKYKLRAEGYDIESVAERVAELLGMEPNQVISNSKNRPAVKARGLVCYWAYNELGISQIDLAKKFCVSQPAISAAVRKGQKLASKQGYELLRSNN